MRYPVPAFWRVRPLVTHDGDTVLVQVDRGDDDQSQWWIRLQGVFAPELSQDGGDACRAYVTQWLVDHADGSDWPFLLQTFRTPRSDVDSKTLGRMVGVITAADHANLNVDVQAFVTAHGYAGGIGS